MVKIKINSISLKELVKKTIEKKITVMEKNQRYYDSVSVQIGHGRTATPLEKRIDSLQKKVKKEILAKKYGGSHVEFFITDGTSKSGTSFEEIAEANGDSTYTKAIYLDELSYGYGEGFKKIRKKSAKGIYNRPFFNPVIDLYYDLVLRKARSKYKDLILEPSKENITIVLQYAGELMKEYYKMWFKSRGRGSWMKNAESTIRRKGKDSPMIDSGALMNEGLGYKIVIASSGSLRYKWSRHIYE